MRAIKQTVTVPASRELHIKLPEEAVAQEEVEVIVLFKTAQSQDAARLAAMHEAAQDEMFLADLRETMDDFQHADGELTAS